MTIWKRAERLLTLLTIEETFDERGSLGRLAASGVPSLEPGFLHLGIRTISWG